MNSASEESRKDHYFTSWSKQRAPGNQPHGIRSRDLGGIFSLTLPAYSGSKSSLSLTSIKSSCKTATRKRTENDNKIQFNRPEKNELLHDYKENIENNIKNYIWKTRQKSEQKIATSYHLASYNNIQGVPFFNLCAFQLQHCLNNLIFLCFIRNPYNLKCCFAL